MPLDTLNHISQENADAAVKAALEHVNEIRAEFGAQPLRELRPGVPNGCSVCPIAESLQDLTDAAGRPLFPRVVFGATHLRPTSSSLVPVRSFPQDEETKDFIRCFDSGWLPELEL